MTVRSLLVLGWSIVVVNLSVAVVVAWGAWVYWWQWCLVALNIAVAGYTWRVALPAIRRLRQYER